ncbi:hypothetical protein [Georgenia sp. H159]|uniref:hypothetical protein n=1 Tax=Georgenia sp. H159 TaxID=3076115 RepID=UPI002D77DF2C|nr:hypothetical protein [Georgenia sp. H159]
MSTDHDRVRASTSQEVLERLDEERLQRVASCVDAAPGEIAEHLRKLDREWDVERVLEANASALTLLGLALSAVHSRRWLVLSSVVPAFLLQHAIQGWCPPLTVIRRLGVRTRREIDVERTALKALRGDFAAGGTGDEDRVVAARRVLEAAAGR